MDVAAHIAQHGMEVRAGLLVDGRWLEFEAQELTFRVSSITCRLECTTPTLAYPVDHDQEFDIHGLTIGEPPVAEVRPVGSRPRRAQAGHALQLLDRWQGQKRIVDVHVLPSYHGPLRRTIGVLVVGELTAVTPIGITVDQGDGVHGFIPFDGIDRVSVSDA